MIIQKKPCLSVLPEIYDGNSNESSAPSADLVTATVCNSLILFSSSIANKSALLNSVMFSTWNDKVLSFVNDSASFCSFNPRELCLQDANTPRLINTNRFSN